MVAILALRAWSRCGDGLGDNGEKPGIGRRLLAMQRREDGESAA